MCFILFTEKKTYFRVSNNKKKQKCKMFLKWLWNEMNKQVLVFK